MRHCLTTFTGLTLMCTAGSATAITFGPQELVSSSWRGTGVTTLDVAADGTLGVTMSQDNVANFRERTLGGVWNPQTGFEKDVDTDGDGEDLREVRGVYVGNDARFASVHFNNSEPYPAWSGLSGSGLGQFINTSVNNARGASMDVAVYGDNIYVAQARGNSGDPLTYVHTSNDGGASWATQQIFESGFQPGTPWVWNQRQARITADETGAYMIFDTQDWSNIYLSSSADGWETGSSSALLVDPMENSYDVVVTGVTEVAAATDVLDDNKSKRGADVARMGGHTYVAYIDGYYNESEQALILKSSADGFSSETIIEGGWTFDFPPQFTQGTDWYNVSVEAAGDQLVILYQDPNSADIKLAYGSGSMWDIQTIYESQDDNVHAPALAVDGDLVYVSYATDGSEYPDLNADPDLVWLQVGVIPEPATASLLAGLGLVMLGRRRQRG
jgi:hypothetical protein